jgi:hypothetical protein
MTMTPLERSKVKNAPLDWSRDRTDFLEWANSIPDGCIAAGREPVYPRLIGSGSPRSEATQKLSAPMSERTMEHRPVAPDRAAVGT